MIQLEDLLKTTVFYQGFTSIDVHIQKKKCVVPSQLGQVPYKSMEEMHNSLLSVPLWDHFGYLKLKHGIPFMFEVDHISFMSLRHTKQILMCHMIKFT